MTPAEEAAFERKAEKHFRSHRPTPAGRNVATWELRHQPESEKRFREKFDDVFPNAPGAGF